MYAPDFYFLMLFLPSRLFYSSFFPRISAGKLTDLCAQEFSKQRDPGVSLSPPPNHTPPPPSPPPPPAPFRSSLFFFKILFPSLLTLGIPLQKGNALIFQFALLPPGSDTPLFTKGRQCIPGVAIFLSAGWRFVRSSSVSSPLRCHVSSCKDPFFFDPTIDRPAATPVKQSQVIMAKHNVPPGLSFCRLFSPLFLDDLFTSSTPDVSVLWNF